VRQAIFNRASSRLGNFFSKRVLFFKKNLKKISGFLQMHFTSGKDGIPMEKKQVTLQASRSLQEKHFSKI